MFDITSSLKNFFITEDTSVEPVFNQSSLQATSKDALYKAPKTQEIDFSYTPLDFVAKASSCHHPYYFFEQKKNSVATNYLMQETASSETAAGTSMHTCLPCSIAYTAIGACRFQGVAI
jgi:hypothetical protein